MFKREANRAFKRFVKKIGDETFYGQSETWFNDSNDGKLQTSVGSKFVSFQSVRYSENNEKKLEVKKLLPKKLRPKLRQKKHVKT